MSFLGVWGCIGVVCFSLVGCGAPKRDFDSGEGGAGGTGGASTSMSGNAGRNVAGSSAGTVGGPQDAGAGGSDPSNPTMEAGAPGAAGDFGEGGAGAGGPDGSIPCTASEYHDGTACLALTVCAAGEFEQSPAKPDQDRVCAKLAQCSSSEYEKTAPTATTNRECSGLSVCGAGTFVSVKPAATSNRQCGACPPSTYSSTLNVDMCGAWSTCKTGETESVAPSATSDRVCSSCGSGKYASGGQCLALTVCKATEYESSPPTATSDRKCAAVTVCQPGSRQTAGPTATTDRQCAACSSGTYSTQINAGTCSVWSTCTTNQYQSNAPSSVVDRVCSTLTSCPAGTRIKTAATATSDRVCQACDSGTFSASANLSVCDNWTTCTSNQYQSTAGTAVANRVCTTLTNCAAGTRIKTAATATSDRVCQACDSGTFTVSANSNLCSSWSDCAAGYSAVAGTSTKNRTCNACASGFFSTTTNAAACTAWTTCTSSQNQTKAGTSTSDVQCTNKPVCSTAPDRVCTVDCPCASGEGTCTASNQCTSGVSCVVGGGKKLGRTGNTCLVSHCDNDKKDADETSVDCGGSCGCRATFEVVTYKNMPAGTSYPGIEAMNGDGTRFAGTFSRSGTAYPMAVAADGTVTELPAYGNYGYGKAISADGNVIVGQMGCSNPPSCTDHGSTECKWVGTANPSVVIYNGSARYPSSTGTYLGGSYYDASLNRYTGFIQNGNALNNVPELRDVNGMTKDGKYLLGTFPDDKGGGSGFFYAPTRTVTKITGPSNWISTSLLALNGNTPVVIGLGYIQASNLYIGFRWRANVFTPLGVLSGTTDSWPVALSNDGSTVVGYTNPFDTKQAFIWTDAGNTRTIGDELKARGYEPPSDFLLKSPKFISEDGKVIVGVEALDPPTFWRVVLN